MFNNTTNRRKFFSVLHLHVVICCTDYGDRLKPGITLEKSMISAGFVKTEINTAKSRRKQVKENVYYFQLLLFINAYSSNLLIVAVYLVFVSFFQ